ncbi:MAG: hypothetical protein RRY08_07460, partial [Christensenella sp.]
QPLWLIYMVAVPFALFFGFGKRKFFANQSRALKIMSILLVCVTGICIFLVFSAIKPILLPEINDYTTGEFLMYFEHINYRDGIFRWFAEVEAVIGLSLYLLLWINTKPRETANAVYKNSTIVRL